MVNEEVCNCGFVVLTMSNLLNELLHEAENIAGLSDFMRRNLASAVKINSQGLKMFCKIDIQSITNDLSNAIEKADSKAMSKIAKDTLMLLNDKLEDCSKLVEFK